MFGELFFFFYEKTVKYKNLYSLFQKRSFHQKRSASYLQVTNKVIDGLSFFFLFVLQSKIRSKNQEKEEERKEERKDLGGNMGFYL